MKTRNNFYYILGKVFIGNEEEFDDINSIKSASDIKNVEHKEDESSVELTPHDRVNGDMVDTMAESLITIDLLENEKTEEFEKTEEAEGTKTIKGTEDINEFNKIEETEDLDRISETNGIDNINEIKEIEGVDFMTELLQVPTCTGENCSECCSIFTDPARRTAFGYTLESASCVCHDICVEDVRDISVKNEQIVYCIPCNPDNRAGCRGGFLPDGPPTIQSWRVLCADENLSPSTGCDRIINNIEFEVVLRYASSAGSTLVVVTPKDVVTSFWYEFAKFPSGTFYPNTTAGLNQFRNELAQIDGSCKVIIINSVTVGVEGNDCLLLINYRLVDKLWKHENLLVSAIKPYVGGGEIDNITVSQGFAQGHQIGACTGSGPCSGIVALA